MPLSAFFMHTPLFISDLGIERIAVTMSIGQLSEVLVLFGLGFIMRRFSYSTIFLMGIVLTVVRFGLFAMADQDSIWMLILGISLHGLLWSFFFEVGRVYLYERAPDKYRAQVQALATLGTSGVGSISGTLLVGLAYHRLITTGPGWPAYWWVLAAWCTACGVGFMLIFRDTPSRLR